MEPPRERELKLELEGPSDYRALAGDPELGEALPALSQRNHYFDTRDWELARSGAMLRLRELRGGEGRVLLTYKEGREDPARPGFFDSLEVECEVPRETLDRAIADPRTLASVPFPPAAALRSRFGTPELAYGGTLATERRRRRAGRFLLELDEVTYPDGGKAYELEVETDEPDLARAWLERELAKRGIRARPQRRTKLENLLARRGLEP